MKSPAYRAYISWRARPINAEDPAYPKNIEEFMTAHKLQKDDIRAFNNDPEYGDDIELEVLSWAKSKIPVLMHRAYNNAEKSGTIADLERFMNILNSRQNKDAQTNNQFNFFGTLTDEQFRRIASREVSLPAPSSTE